MCGALWVRDRGSAGRGSRGVLTPPLEHLLTSFHTIIIDYKSAIRRPPTIFTIVLTPRPLVPADPRCEWVDGACASKSGSTSAGAGSPTTPSTSSRGSSSTSGPGMLTQGGRGAARSPWPDAFVGLRTSRCMCMGSTGSYLSSAPLADRKLSPQVWTPNSDPIPNPTVAAANTDPKPTASATAKSGKSHLRRSGRG